MKIFLTYLQEAEKEPEITRIIYQNNLLELLINFTKFLNQETINSVITFFVHLIAFDKSESKADSKDASSSSRSFVRQFI